MHLVPDLPWPRDLFNPRTTTAGITPLPARPVPARQSRSNAAAEGGTRGVVLPFWLRSPVVSSATLR